MATLIIPAIDGSIASVRFGGHLDPVMLERRVRLFLTEQSLSAPLEVGTWIFPALSLYWQPFAGDPELGIIDGLSGDTIGSRLAIHRPGLSDGAWVGRNMRRIDDGDVILDVEGVRWATSPKAGPEGMTHRITFNEMLTALAWARGCATVARVDEQPIRYNR